MAGHVVVAASYGMYEVLTRFIWKREVKNIDPAELLFYRFVYPGLFIETDRRNTINMLRVGLPPVLLVEPWWLPMPLFVRIGVALVGLFMFFNAYLGLFRIADYEATTVAAAQRAERTGVPFVQSTPRRKGKSNKGRREEQAVAGGS